MSSDLPILYDGTINDARGNSVLKVRVYDCLESWAFNFGVDGPDIGLFTVTVAKYRIAHLNMMGALEVALRELQLKNKEAGECGLALGDIRKRNEIEGKL